MLKSNFCNPIQNLGLQVTKDSDKLLHSTGDNFANVLFFSKATPNQKLMVLTVNCQKHLGLLMALLA
jgi:hypothetical protein